MKQIIFIFLFIVTLSNNAIGQRNRFKPVGVSWSTTHISNIRNGSDGSGAGSFLGWAYQVGFERSLGTRISVGINYFYVSQAGGEYEGGYEVMTEKIVPGSSGDIPEKTGYYFEKLKHGFMYECKYFFSEFDDEAEGAYISSNIGFYTATQRLTQIRIQDGFGNSIGLPDESNAYRLIQYGIKLGIQAGYGDLYIGWLFNSTPNRKETLMLDDTKKFDKTLGCFTVGYCLCFDF